MTGLSIDRREILCSGPFAELLAPANYHIARTLKVTLPNRWIEGQTGFANGCTTIRQLVLTVPRAT